MRSVNRFADWTALTAERDRFSCGNVRDAGRYIVTAGGRVLGITGRGATLADAQAAAYRMAKQIAFKGCHYRHDIAYRALAPRG